MSIWKNNDRIIVLRTSPMADWYERFDFDMVCWVIGKWDHYRLIKENWKQIA